MAEVNKKTKTLHYDLLDLIKGIAAICVVFVHIRFPGNTGAIMSSFGTCGVTIFFLVSGYFIYDPGNDRRKMCDRILKRVGRNMIITLIVMVLYFLYTYNERRMYGGLSDWLTEFTDPITYIRMMFPGDFAVISGEHLWFMASLLFAYLIIWLFIQFKIEGKIKYMLPVLMCVRIGLELYTSSFGTHWLICSNALVAALPVMALGYVIAEKKKEAFEMTSDKLGILVIISVALMIASSVFRIGTFDLSPIFKMMTAVTVFMFCIDNPDCHPPRALTVIGAKDALYIYVIHYMMIDPIIRLVHKIPYSPIPGEWLVPILVAVFAVITAMIIRIVADLIGSLVKRRG